MGFISQNTSHSIQSDPNVAGLVLAAGTSSRMGTPKQLLPVAGQPLIYRVVKAALRSRLDKVVLVLGHEARKIKDSISELIRHPKLEIVENPSYKDGMSTSIKAGLKVIENDFAHMMVILADMPHIDTPLIDQLLKVYLDSGCYLGAVKIGGRRSHPVIFSRKLFPEFHALQGEMGGRRLFDLYEDKACFLDPGPSYIHTDIDTPEDYETYSRETGLMK